MDTKMQTDNLQFWDGVLIDDCLWGVDKKYLFLFCVNTDSWEIEQLIDLKEVAGTGYVPRKIFHFGECLFVTPTYGAKIVCVNICSGELSLLGEELDKGRDSANANAVLYGQKLYLFPRNMQDDIVECCLETGRVMLRQCCWSNCEHGMVINFAVVDNLAWSVMVGSNKLIGINLDTFTYQIKELQQQYCLLDLVYESGFLWLLEAEGIVKCTASGEVCETAGWPEKEKFTHIMAGDNQLFLTTGTTLTLTKYDVETKRFMALSVDKEACERTGDGSLVYGYCRKDKSTLLFPWACTCLLEYESDSPFLKTHSLLLPATTVTSLNGQNVREYRNEDLKKFVANVMCFEEWGCIRENVAHIGEEIYRSCKKELR